MDQYVWLIPLGFVVGAFGTLIGAGGGFVLMPVLLLIYPRLDPKHLTAISLAVVFCNAVSGSVAYGRMRRIDYRSGLFFAAASVPGAILGAFSTAWIPRRQFNVLFGALLIGMAVYLLVNPSKGGSPEGAPLGNGNGNGGGGGHPRLPARRLALGMVLSLGVGFLSSLLGIGGGIIHVPALVYLMAFPIHVATATSHFMLAIMTLSGTAVHVFDGTLARGLTLAVGLAIGVVPGAQVGAKLSKRIHGHWIIRSLAVALGFVGLRILAMAW